MKFNGLIKFSCKLKILKYKIYGLGLFSNKNSPILMANKTVAVQTGRLIRRQILRKTNTALSTNKQHMLFKQGFYTYFVTYNYKHKYHPNKQLM